MHTRLYKYMHFILLYGVNRNSRLCAPQQLRFPFYHPRMWEGNVFILSVYLYVCLSVWTITFECLDIEILFWYGGTT